MHPSRYQYFIDYTAERSFQSLALFRRAIYGRDEGWDAQNNLWVSHDFLANAYLIFSQENLVTEQEARSHFPLAFIPPKRDEASITRDRDGFETIDLPTLKHLLGFYDYMDLLKFNTLHEKFFNFYEVKNRVAMCQLQIYLRENNLGFCLTEPYDLPFLRPDYCCQTHDRVVCLRWCMVSKVRQILENNGYKEDSVSERKIWQDLQTTTQDTCILFHIGKLEYTLFEMFRDGELELIKDSDYRRHYKFKEKEIIKRGPGRPRKI